MTERAFFYIDGIPTKGCWVELDTISDMSNVVDTLFQAGYVGDAHYDGDILASDTEGYLAEHFVGQGDAFDLDQFIEARDCNVDDEVIAAYLENGLEFNLANIQEAYVGKFRSQREFVEEYVEQTGLLANVPCEVGNYFDFEKYGDDLMTEMFEVNDHYFRNL